MLSSRKVLAVLGSTIVLAATLVACTPADAAATCTLVNKYYPNGVSASKYSKNVGTDIMPPKVRSSVYKKYKYLDLDRDTIVCEKEITDKQLLAFNSLYASGPTTGGSLEGINFLVSNNVSKEVLKHEKSLLKIATSVWASYQVKDVSVAYFTRKDAVWLQDILSQYGGRMSPGKTVQQWLDTYPNQCTVAFATKGLDEKPIFYLCVDDKVRDKSYDQTGIHEYFHLVQDSLGISGANAPSWLIEGSAAYFGATLATKDYKFAKKFAGYTGKVYVQDAISVMRKLEDPDRRFDGYSLNHYGMGSLATQLLIADYGYEKFMEFLKAIPNEGWKESMISNFGIDSESFYKNYADYLKVLYN